MKTRRHSRRRRNRKARRNPLGPFTGHPVLAGVLAWLAVGAVGNAVLTSVARSVARSQPDPLKADATIRLVGTGLLIGQVAGSIAAYRAAKT